MGIKMKFSLYILLFAASVLYFNSCAIGSDHAQKNIITMPDLKAEKDSMSYALGMNIGNSIRKDTIVKNKNLVKLGMIAGIDNDTTMMNEERVQELLIKFNEYLAAEQKKQTEILKEKNLKEGREFLAKNKLKAGVKETASGLQYEVLKEGTGKQPTADNVVVVHYHGTLLNGDVFDSSISRGKPAEFALNRVIKGWTEGVQLMKEGAKYKFYIPSDLAYGDRAMQGIGPNSLLIFEVELLEVKDSK